jgi:tetratricopeptide (TPR) repeat protein
MGDGESNTQGEADPIQRIREQLEQLVERKGDLPEDEYEKNLAALEGRLRELQSATRLPDAGRGGPEKDQVEPPASRSIQTGDLRAQDGSTLSVAGGNITQTIYQTHIYSSAPETHSIPSDLPPYTRPFGRDAELKDLYEKWIDGIQRLLVYGARGMGKACLARALARQVLETPNRPRFHACLWWSAGYSKEFEDLLHYLRSALASMVGLDPHALSNPERVREALLQRPCLLVITKIRRQRHSRIIDFLDGIPGSSTIILTSTTPIAGWGSRRLQQLSINASLDMLKQKSRLVSCEYILDAPQDKLNQLCELCDGSPVALSMVIKVFQGENPDIDLLLENLSTGKDAFRTLCAIAYEDLSELAKTVFAFICLSHTGFSAQTIQDVLKLDQQALREALSELVDAGLAMNTAVLDFEVRRFYPAFRLVREYYQKVVRNARRKADRELNERLAEYYLAQCQINGAENWQGHAWLETEISEVLAVIDALYKRSEWERYFAMLEAIYYFLGVRGYWRQKRNLGLQAAQAARLVGDPQREALALVRVAGWTEIQLRMFTQAEDHLQMGLKIYQALQDAGGQASALRYLGTLKRRTDDFSTARELYQAAIQACEPLASPSRQRLQAGIQVSLSMLHIREGRNQDARRLLEGALETFQLIGHLSKIAEVYSRLGDLDLLEGDLDSAETHFQQSQSKVQESGRSKTRAYNLLGMARLQAMRGNGEASVQLAEEARKLFGKLEISDEVGELQELMRLLGGKDGG